MRQVGTTVSHLIYAPTVLLAHVTDEETEVIMVKSLASIYTTSKRHCHQCAETCSHGLWKSILCISSQLLNQWHHIGTLKSTNRETTEIGKHCKSGDSRLDSHPSWKAKTFSRLFWIEASPSKKPVSPGEWHQLILDKVKQDNGCDLPSKSQTVGN